MDLNRQHKRIAIVGSGISGLASAWLLHHHAEITLYEADTRLGGHTHTYNVHEGDRVIPIDTGFMVYNQRNYPNLTQLFRHLGIASYQTDMSFAVTLDNGRHEYAGSGINSLFGQRSNLLKPGHWKMLRDIVKFNRLASQDLAQLDEQLSLGDYLDRHQLGNEFRFHYLYPMAAAIWSCPRSQMQYFPASRFIRFFHNHGLLSVNDHPQWYTVDGGASSYISALTSELGRSVRSGERVTQVVRRPDGVTVLTEHGHEDYDEVILACHSDQALKLLDQPSITEQLALNDIPYQSNRVLLHTDKALMPQRRRVWSSWNFIGKSGIDESLSPVSVTYWMNSLQSLATSTDYFVSLNPLTEPEQDSIVAELAYDHPVFGNHAVRAQQLIQQHQGENHTWYCGAWLGYGFHEDGLQSAVSVARKLGANIPWQAVEDNLPGRQGQLHAA